MVDILIDMLKLTDKDEYLKLMKEFRPLDTKISNDKFKNQFYLLNPIHIGYGILFCKL